MKRFLALILTFLMIAFMFTSCIVVEQKESSQENEPKESSQQSEEESEEEVSQKAEEKNEPTYVRKVNNCTEVLGKTGKWFSLESLSLESLNTIVNDAKYAECHDEARRLMMKK